MSTTQSSENSQERLLKVSDLTTRYGVSRGTIFNWLKLGMPTAVRRGKVLRFHAEVVDEWVARSRCLPVAPGGEVAA